MTVKDKIIFILLSIITIGIYPIVVLRKKEEVKDQLSTSNKLTINTAKLLDALGGEDNVMGSEYTHTKVKIFFKDKTTVNVEAIKEIKGISGVFATSKYLTIIVGNQARLLAQQL